jgi:hypothetical protein
VPSFAHQLSLDGSYGAFGGQSRLFGIAAIEWYSELLNTTFAPLAYAVHEANAGTPEQLTWANAGTVTRNSAAIVKITSRLFCTSNLRENGTRMGADTPRARSVLL